MIDDDTRASIRAAAAKLRDLQCNGCILADGVGFGKTKQCLLVAYLHTLLMDEKDPADNAKTTHKPILMTVPPSLINSWIQEIREEWPYFDLIISYSDHDYASQLSVKTLTTTAMKQYPSMQAIPSYLRYPFNKSDPAARKCIVLTSYETHKRRTGTKHTSVTPGIPFQPSRKDENGNEIWSKAPKHTITWTTNHDGTFSLLVADEAQKVKNYLTGISAVLFNHNIPKMVLATATPFYNTIQDLLGLLHLIFNMAEKEFRSHLSSDDSASQAYRVMKNAGNILERIDKLPRLDPLRLVGLDPNLILPVLTGDKNSIHLEIVAKLKPVLEMSMIRRSPSSSLPNEDGSTTELRPLFKETIRQTARIARRGADAVEYQYHHRKAAE